jgi:hypothetical protein
MFICGPEGYVIHPMLGQPSNLSTAGQVFIYNKHTGELTSLDTGYAHRAIPEPSFVLSIQKKDQFSNSC